MEFRSYKELVNTLRIGKQLPDAVYVHTSALDTVPLELAAHLARAVAALDRVKLSAPMQALARHNYLDGNYSIFDYGCGKGDDVRELEAHVLDVAFWDPIYHPEGIKTRADIVNLGYVINVIEERQERDGVLRDAFKHTEKILAISAMLASDSAIGQFTPYKDGVLTKRNTFQKYYTQSELRSYIENTLSTSAIADRHFVDPVQSHTLRMRTAHAVL